MTRAQRARESFEKLYCFNLSIFPQCMDSDNRAHNYGLLIVQAQKIVLLQEVVSDEVLAIRMTNYPIRLLSYLQPIIITSISYQYHYKNSHSPGIQLINLIFILSLASSYTIHAPLHTYV